MQRGRKPCTQCTPKLSTKGTTIKHLKQIVVKEKRPERSPTQIEI